MRNIIIPLIFLLNILSVAQNKIIYKNFDAGSYKVGFKEVAVVDYSRIYNNAFRKIQVALWYPVDNVIGKRLKFSDYFNLYLSEDNSLSLPKNNKSFWANQFSADKNNFSFDDLWNSDALATFTPISLSKKYPVILYAAGGQGESFENFLICELLASEGFIVAAIPSIGTYIHEIEITKEGLVTQTNDLLSIISYLNQQSYTKTDEVGVFGWSWGALAGLYLQTQYFPVKAYLSLDGSIAGYEDVIRTLPYYSITKITVPTFFISLTSSTANRVKKYYEKILYSKSTYLALNSVDHGDFNVYSYLSNQYSNNKENSLSFFYPFLAKVTQNFFSHCLIEKDTTVYTVTSSNPLIAETMSHDNIPRPMREDELISLIKKEGADKGIEKYKEMKKADTSLVVFDAFEMTKVAFSLVRDSVRSDEAVKIMKMVLSEYPYSASSYALTGRIHEIRGELLDALKYFSIAYGMKTDYMPGKEVVFYENRQWYSKKIEEIENKLRNIK